MTEWLPANPPLKGKVARVTFSIGQDGVAIKFMSRHTPIPLPTSPLKGEESHSLPFKGKVAPATFSIGRVRVGMGIIGHSHLPT